MRVLIVTQYFWPESFKGNDVAIELTQRGHQVTVLTGKPNYPTGKFYKGYNFWNKRKEGYKGIKVIRSPLISRGKGTGTRLFLNYLSFMVFASFTAIFRVRGKFDAIFVQQLSPITSAIPAIVLKKVKKCPLYLWVLDLWPESIQSAGNIQNKMILGMIRKMVKYVYHHSDKILISSKGFQASINNHIYEKKEIIYFPNWAEDVFLGNPIHSTDILDIDFPKGFTIMFAGNIGEAQDFNAILVAIEKTKEQPINWVFIGDGRKRPWVEKEIKNRSLNNAYLFGQFPVEMMPNFFAKADAMLVSLKDEPIFSRTVPAKIQAYLASGKIIIGMLNGEGADVLNESGSGLVCNAGDGIKLAELAEFVSSLPIGERKKREIAAREYYANNFKKEFLMNKLENLLVNNI